MDYLSCMDEISKGYPVDNFLNIAPYKNNSSKVSRF